MRVHEEVGVDEEVGVEVDEEVEVGRHQKQIGVDLLPNSPLRRSAGRSRARRREMFLELPGVNLCIITEERPFLGVHVEN